MIRNIQCPILLTDVLHRLRNLPCGGSVLPPPPPPPTSVHPYYYYYYLYPNHYQQHKNGNKTNLGHGNNNNNISVNNNNSNSGYNETSSTNNELFNGINTQSSAFAGRKYFGFIYKYIQWPNLYHVGDYFLLNNNLSNYIYKYGE